MVGVGMRSEWRVWSRWGLIWKGGGGDVGIEVFEIKM